MYTRKSELLIILVISAIVIPTTLFVTGVFTKISDSEKNKYVDINSPEYHAFLNFIGDNTGCSFLRSTLQQDYWIKGQQLLDMYQLYTDQGCGDPTHIPKQYSVTVNSTNISTITRDDLNFSSIPRNHTVVIDCIIYNISKNENSTKFDRLMTKNGCNTNSTDILPIGKWRYFN